MQHAGSTLMRVSPRETSQKNKVLRFRKNSLNVEPTIRNYGGLEPLLKGKYDEYLEHLKRKGTYPVGGQHNIRTRVVRANESMASNLDLKEDAKLQAGESARRRKGSIEKRAEAAVRNKGVRERESKRASLRK